MTFTSALRGLLGVREASAHCDIPCGIYDPIAAKIAAQTVQKMVLRIGQLEGDDASGPKTRCPAISPSRKSTPSCASTSSEYSGPTTLGRVLTRTISQQSSTPL